MTPDEVMRIGENEALVRTGNRYPMRLWKIYYDERAVTARARALGPAQVVRLAPAQREPVSVPPLLPEAE